MNDAVRVRTAVIGLVNFAAAEEQMLLAAAGRDGAERGSPARWAARPLVAHNTEFRDQQVQRLAAIREGRVPPNFAETDHSSPEVYRRCCEQPANVVAEASRRTAQALVAGLSALPDEDLLDPERHSWLHGRQLWLHPVRGMACYSLACAQARSGRPDDAFDALSEAVARNAHLLANAVRDADLRSLRDTGRLDALL
jgi:hypothetical protein